MTIRENLIISLGLLSIYLLLKFNQKNSLSYLNLVILSMIYSYLIGAHMLVALIAGGVIGIYFLDYLINKGDIKKLFIFIFLVCIISFPFIHAQYEAIIAQLHHGQEFITERGFTVSYSYIKSSYFNL